MKKYLKNEHTIYTYIDMSHTIKYYEISTMLNEFDPKDRCLLIALYDLITNTCHIDKDTMCYYFSIDDETDANDDHIIKWVDIIHKIVPFNNITVLKKSKKKLLMCIRHLCKNLEHKKISIISKVIPFTKDNKVTTKRMHYINGLEIDK